MPRVSRFAVALLIVIAQGAGRARAQAAEPRASAPPPSQGSAPSTPARAPTYALFRLDALGLAPEIVDQLERILRVEVSRVVGGPLPARAAVDAVLARNPGFQGCTGDPSCLGPIAAALGVDRIVAGNVGGLGDSYVINLKLVAASGQDLGRATAELRGRPDELIQEVRLAAYRLIASEQLVGAISLLSEVPGATVFVDDRAVGVTPLAKPVGGLRIGDHTLRVARAGYADFVDRVPVRFEKSTEVVVHQRAVTVEAKVEEAERVAPAPRGPPFYSRWWFWLGAGSAAVGVGVGIGALIAPRQTAVLCTSGAACP